MMDMLPFLRTIGGTPEEQISEITTYLLQFKETLEFILMNISTENLSPELINKLNELGANIKKNAEDREEAIAQLSKNNVLSIYDVINSELFKSEVKNTVSNIKFTINFDNGCLEYAMS